MKNQIQNQHYYLLFLHLERIQIFKSNIFIQLKIREDALKVPKSAKRKMRSIYNPIEYLYQSRIIQ